MWKATFHCFATNETYTDIIRASDSYSAKRKVSAKFAMTKGKWIDETGQGMRREQWVRQHKDVGVLELENC